MVTRALRRHHSARLKNKRKRYLVLSSFRDTSNIEDLLRENPRFAIYLKVPVVCSCSGCGNPRKWFRGEHALTLQEVSDRQLQKVLEKLEMVERLTSSQPLAFV